MITRRTRAVVAVAGCILLAAVTPCAGQGVAVITRASILRSGPRKESEARDRLKAGDLVLLMNRKQAGYVRVQSDDEQVGWVIAGNLRELDESETHILETHHDTPAPPVPPAGHLVVQDGTFDGCPVGGNPSKNGSRYAEILGRNTLKNRSRIPRDEDVDATITLAKLVGHGADDTHAFDETKAAEVKAYVLHVKPGGRTETTNCRDSTVVHRDTHIELTLSETDTALNRRVIVEVTPRWRKALLDQQSIDWSTKTLQHTIERKWVNVRGWLFFDSEHTAQAENTNPGGESNWRATAWELHPISMIRVTTP